MSKKLSIKNALEGFSLDIDLDSPSISDLQKHNNTINPSIKKKLSTYNLQKKDSDLKNIIKQKKANKQVDERVENGYTTGSKRVDERVVNGYITGSKRVEKKANMPTLENERVDERVDERVVNGYITGSKRVEKPSIYEVIGIQRKIVNFIFSICQSKGEKITPPLTLEDIHSGINSSTKISIKNAIFILINKKKILISHDSKEGNGGWRKYRISDAVFSELILETGRKRVENGYITGSKRVDERVDERVETLPSSSSNIYINKELTTSDDNFYDPGAVRGQQAIAPEFDPEWQQIDISALDKIGFTNNHLSQIFIKGELTPNQVQESINAFAFDLDYNDRAKTIKTKPLNLFMGILKKGQEYSAPENYESDIDREIRIMKERSKTRQAKLEEYKQLSFSEWVATKNVEERKQFLNLEDEAFQLMPPQAIKTSLRAHFDEKVWPSIEASKLIK